MSGQVDEKVARLAHQRPAENGCTSEARVGLTPMSQEWDRRTQRELRDAIPLS
jgi:hypothetical protein